MKEFKGNVAVVTGAASGIRYALAEKFALEGMKVVLSDIEETALSKTNKEFQDRGYEVRSMITDVSNEADVKLLAMKTLDEFGAVQILCNNAGVFGEFAPVWEQSVET
jgi:NAD(P)-dependent dehydrogenase (short-subunit alcohol dehydrogenase family)